MDYEMIQAIYKILQNMERILMHISTKEDTQAKEEFARSREEITTLLETEGKYLLRTWIEVDALSDADWIQEMHRVLDELEHPFVVKNKYDREFIMLINYFWANSKEVLVNKMKENLKKIKADYLGNYEVFVQYFTKYSLWGSLNPEQEDYGTFELRAKVLKERSFEFIWLYKKLGDYLSKRTLTAILKNWALLYTDCLSQVTSKFMDYYEPDFFPDNDGDVFVDVGAFDGDSILNYVAMYGANYKKIYAYEIAESSCAILKERTKMLSDIIVRQKGAGKESGYMKLVEGAVSASNHLEYTGKMGIKKETENNLIEIVALDEDIDEEVTFIKMDIEGSEQDALMGSERIIKTYHPKLAICTYHGYDDIWKIPRIIDTMHPGYNFYMRYNGGNLIPTEFVLLCKDVQKY